MVVFSLLLGPVGSGRDRKNEEKFTKCESDLVVVNSFKKEAGLFLP